MLILVSYIPIPFLLHKLHLPNKRLAIPQPVTKLQDLSTPRPDCAVLIELFLNRWPPPPPPPPPHQQRNTYLEQVGHPLRASLRHFVGYQDRVPLCLWIFDVACHFVFTANEVIGCCDIFLDILIGMIRAAFDHLCSTANKTFVCQQLASYHEVICPSQAMLKRAGRVLPPSFFIYFFITCPSYFYFFNFFTSVFTWRQGCYVIKTQQFNGF